MDEDDTPDRSTVRMSVTVPTELWRRLTAVTKELGVSRNELVNTAILQYLAALPPSSEVEK